MTSRIDAIASQIRACASGITDDDDAHDAAKAAAKAAGEVKMNTRETLMSQLCALSRDDKWTPGEIDGAAKLAVAKGNQTSKSMATFVSELKRVVKPGIRDDFDRLIEVRNAAMEAEREGDDKPCKAAWSRGYHVLLTGLVKPLEDGFVIFTVEGLQEHARACDPARDPDKVFKKLEGIREQLEAIYAVFQVDDIGAALDDLRYVKDSGAFRALAAPKPATTVMKPAPVAPVLSTAVENTVDDSAGAPLAGVCDWDAELESAMGLAA